MFKTMMNDKVSLVKKDGTFINDIRALVQSDLILIDDENVPVEEGDTIARELPSGLVEKYVIIDRGYVASIFGVPAHYQIKVRKEGTVRSGDAFAGITYNLQGPHSRVNVNSEDHSINVSSVNSENVFAELRRTIQDQIGTKDIQEALLTKLAELEEAKGSPTFTKKYRDFVGLAADYMTILAPFIPSLTQLLS